jgi:hypothetical protein
MNKDLNRKNISESPSGIVLLVTLVLLVVLASLGYTFSSRIIAQRRRNQYIIDYNKARYGCDSALKYALASLEDINPQLISRPNEPDFSDLYALSQAEYQKLLSQADSQTGGKALNINKNSADITDANNGQKQGAGDDELNNAQIRGPYGSQWPLVTEPAEFEIGTVTVRIEVEDENAKYPLGWAILNDKPLEREADAGYITFCEMMGLDAEQISSLKNQLKQIAEIKPFNIDFQTIITSEVVKSTTTATGSTAGGAQKMPAATQPVRKIISTSSQILEQTRHFAKFFHSSFVDIEALARPIIVNGVTRDPALKYIGTWASHSVNINTAPRPVLEAAFTFGGNQVEIAQAIIQRRRIEPFENLSELKKVLFRYSDSISKSEKFISTASSMFTIKITATSGLAKASSIIAIMKSGQQIEKIAIINS